MLITVEIKKCFPDCRHASHSGAFTKGGSKPVCDGPNVCDIVRKFKNLPDNDDKYHWKHRVFKINKPIPAWCPLRNGEQY